MAKYRRSSLFLFVCGAVLVGACGGGSSSIRVSEFTEEHAKLFEDSVDFVVDPQVLEERSREDWDRALESRFNLSDFVGIVTVTTLLSDVDLEKRTTVRLVSTIVRSLQGTVPSKDLSFAVAEDQDGYFGVAANQQRLLNQRFVAFVKWYKQGNAAIVARWHLCPASDKIIEKIERIAASKQKNTHVVHVAVHKN